MGAIASTQHVDKDNPWSACGNLYLVLSGSGPCACEHLRLWVAPLLGFGHAASAVTRSEQIMIYSVTAAYTLHPKR